jgi:diaminohydroxyphosphoribosylaminopyrimidine deaminase/5-amino-6-(5-phosphoribosylamino)uracil reductase
VGATLYVNLEPCDHQGRTPPCTAAIIPAGIQRVVVGTLDSDPRVSGRGCDRLRAAGIDLTLGILEAECRAINEGFFYRLRHGQPLGLWKYAMTLDGKIATSTGHSQWITSPPARHYVHQLRGDCDAVITGGNTVRLDNPQLTCHGAHPTNPLRVILTRSFRLPHQAQVWQVGDAPTLVVTEVAALQGQDDRRALLEQQGVEVLALPQLTIASVVATLGQRGCNQVLWECGAPLAAAAMAARAVQKVYAFIAPKIIGGHGNGAIANLGITHMDQAIHLSRTSWQTVGDDWLLVGYVDPLS